jgi:hypothetical protein
VRTIDDFAHYSARLRAAIGPHIVDILRQGLSVVLDFPANTVTYRKWMRSLITQADVATSFICWISRTRSASRGLGNEMRMANIRTK